MILAMSKSYLVTVPGLGTYAIDATDRAAALADIATEIWTASNGTVAVDTRFCTVATAISVGAGVELYL